LLAYLKEVRFMCDRRANKYILGYAYIYCGSGHILNARLSEALRVFEFKGFPQCSQAALKMVLVSL
jgi:hypothetical protein